MAKTSMIPEHLSRYRVIKKIGSGGMCEVYLAADLVLHRNVALKILSRTELPGKDPQRRFIREAEATAKLNHPNICSIYEVGTQDGICFIAMEYVEGETLTSKMLAHPLAVEEIVDIAAQVADALAEAHANGIIHRDVKPHNIMITPRGRIKVLDFGLAKVLQDQRLAASREQTQSLLTGPGTIVGTVAYMSPEQARGEPLGARSDIFSLGIVIYEMLSGRHPFKAPSEAATVSMILTHDPPQLVRYLPDVPDELQRIVTKCLCKGQELRYQGAQELHIDLVRLKEDLVFAARLERSKDDHSRENGSIDLRDPVAGVSAKTKRFERTTREQTGFTEPFFNRSRILKSVLAIAFLFAIFAAAWFSYFSLSKSDDSIAVLPFIFSNADTNQLDTQSEYLSDGLTESIINSLSQFPTLKVTARASVFRYKGKELDLQQIGRDLGVRTVFLGRIIRHGDNLTIKAELSDVHDNRQIWGTEYERKSSSLFGLHREIATDILQNLKVRVTKAEESRLNKSYTDNPEAYDLYLRGRYYWNKRTEDGFKKGVDFFQQSIQKDPSYALAYSGLADSYMLLSDWGFLPPVEGYSKARDAVVRALSIDDQLAEAHTSLAGIKVVLDWDWAGAESEYKKAIALNPNYATAHQWYAYHLMLLGRQEEALTEITLAQRLDPLSLGINKDFAVVLLYARRYDEALEQSRKTLEIDPSFLTMYTAMAQAYEGKQMNSEAVVLLQKAHDWLPDDLEISYGLAQAFALAGRKNEAEQIMNDLSKLPSQRQFLPKEMALVYTLLGEKEKAFEILEKAYEQHYFVVSEIKVDTRFDALHSDPRYADLLQRMGLR